MKRVASIETLAEYLGAAAAVRITQELGGTSLKVPKHKAGRVWEMLLRHIGERSAADLVECFGGEGLYIARNAAEEREQRRAQVAALLAQGKSYAEIARTMTVTTRFTERGLRRMMCASAHAVRTPGKHHHHPGQLGLQNCDGTPALPEPGSLGAVWGSVVGCVCAPG